MESVFRPDIFWIFSSDFLAVSREKHKKIVGIHRKNPETFWPEYCFHVSLISGVFLQEPTPTS
jgi:hypothetical protein